MSFDPEAFSLAQALQKVQHLTSQQTLGAHLLTRYALAEPQLQALVVLADHGIADTLYSRKSKTYTFAQTIASSEGAIEWLEHAKVPPIYYDISVDRYWPMLEGVVNQKIARGTTNFLKKNALEPQRLMQALSFGAGLVEDLAPESVLYLCDLGAGNDIACEALLQSVWNTKGSFASVNASELLDFTLKYSALETVDPSHPLNYLERFGGYDTAVYFGVLHRARERGLLVVVDGWAALAAFALSLRFQPDTGQHALMGSSFSGSIAANFFAAEGIEPLSSEVNDIDGGQQFHELQKLLSTTWKAAVNA